MFYVKHLFKWFDERPVLTVHEPFLTVLQSSDVCRKCLERFLFEKACSWFVITVLGGFSEKLFGGCRTSGVDCLSTEFSEK